MDDVQARELVARIDGLLDRTQDVELAQALVDLYGEGLARIVAREPEVAARLADDELVRHLLLLHDLHPVPLRDRVLGALAEVRPYLESHGGDVELLGLEEGVARLRLQGTCNGCPSSSVTLKHAVEQAIREAAPEVDRIEAEGAPEPGLIQIEVSDALTCPTELHGVGR